MRNELCNWVFFIYSLLHLFEFIPLIFAILLIYSIQEADDWKLTNLECILKKKTDSKHSSWSRQSNNQTVHGRQTDDSINCRIYVCVVVCKWHIYYNLFANYTLYCSFELQLFSNHFALYAFRCTLHEKLFQITCTIHYSKYWILNIR